MEKHGIGLYATYIGKGNYIYGHKIVWYEDDGTKSKEELLYEWNMEGVCETYRDDDLLDLIDMK